jgi:radical SAM superfamily enzyme YgiQ (UPF0313 family)
MTNERQRLNVGLINLHARSDSWSDTVMVPLGLMYLSAALKRTYAERVRISLHDMTLVPRDVELTESVERFIRENSFDIVGIRGFSSQAHEFSPVAQCIKRLRKDCLVVVGGPHPSTRSAGLFAESAIDIVALGEGEETIVELVGNVLSGRPITEVPGIGWVQDGRPTYSPPRVPIEDLDAIPRPDYEILDLDHYQGNMTMTSFPPRRRYTSLFTSRGCHYKCTYCHDNFGKQVRYRSVENTLDEMRFLIEEHGVREFHVIDDIFNADRRRAIRIFEAVDQRGWDIDIAFPNGLRADIMNEEFIAAARRAGVYYWALAVETATPRLQKMVQKHNRLDKVFETIALSNKYNVITATFNMLGFPTETEAEMEATIQFNLDSDAHLAHFFKVTPFEGTAMHEQLQNGAGVVPPSDMLLGYTAYSDDRIDHVSTVPASRIQEMIVDFYRRFYFDPARMQQFFVLLEHGHDASQFSAFFADRLRSVGDTVDDIQDPKTRECVRRLLVCDPIGATGARAAADS